MGFTYQMLQFQEERMAAAALVLAPLEKVIQQTADYCRQRKVNVNPVLRIRDVYPGSEFFSTRIPDQNFSIPDPGLEIFSFPEPNIFHPVSASKNLSILTQKIVIRIT